MVIMLNCTAGQDFSITASGSVSDTVTSATYHVTVKFDDMVVMDKKGSLSDYISMPLQPNQLINIQKTQKVPDEVPDGDVDINGIVYDQNNDILLCVNVKATLGPDGSSVTHNNNNNIEPYTGVTNVIPDMSMQGYIDSVKMKQYQQQMIQKQFEKAQQDAITNQQLQQQARLQQPQQQYDDMSTQSQDQSTTYSDDDNGTEIEFTLCGDDNDSIQIQSLKASNWPLVPGKPLILYVTANVLDTVDSGSYEAKVLFDGLQVIDKKDTLEHLGVQLPLTPGTHKFSKQFDIPKNLPQGQVQLNAVAHNTDGKELVCTSVELQV